MTDAILTAENLSRHYDVKRGMFKGMSTVQALGDASFTLHPGRTLGVVGESGCGKSTLARLVTMIEPPTSGRMSIDGKDVSEARHQADLRSVVQIVFQDPYGSLNPRQRVGDILQEPLKINTDMTAAQREADAVSMMERVGLRSEHIGRYPHMFSGGQRQRIAIARALMLRPRIVVLDEPVSALDVSIQAQVLNLLADLQDEFGLAYMFISHDLSVVRHVADEVMVMYLGRVVESGPREAIFAHPRHPYTQALLSATPSVDRHERQNRIKLSGELPSPIDPPSGCPFHPRCFAAEDACARVFPDREDAGHGQTVSCHRWRALIDT